MNESCLKCAHDLSVIVSNDGFADTVGAITLVREECHSIVKNDGSHLRLLSDTVSKNANNELYEKHKKTILIILNSHFYWCSEEMKEDLVQEGLIALMRAREKFDENYGSDFSNYAFSAIRTTMKRYYENNSSTVREFVHVKSEKHKVRQLIEKNNRNPSIEEVEEYLGVSRKSAIRILNDYDFSGSALSLDEELGDNKGVTLYDVHADKKYMPDKELMKTGSIMNQLTACKKVIDNFFRESRSDYWNVFLDIVGLDENGEHVEKMKYKEVGMKYGGVSKQRIGQMWNRISNAIKEELDIDFEAK